MRSLLLALVVVVVVGLMALIVDLDHSQLVRSQAQLAGVKFGPVTLYQVRYRATLVERLDRAELPLTLLDGEDCNQRSLTAAYEAVGFDNVEVVVLKK